MRRSIVPHVAAAAAALYLLLQPRAVAQQDERIPILVTLPDPGPAAALDASSLQILQQLGFTRDGRPPFRTCDPPRAVIAGTLPATGIDKYHDVLRNKDQPGFRIYDNPTASPQYANTCLRPTDIGEGPARTAAGLDDPKLANGKGVVLAIVDLGVDMRRLAKRFPQVTSNSTFSWPPNATTIYGEHGTDCAYVAAIAAPAVAIADVRVSGDTHSFGEAYDFLQETWRTHGKQYRALVVSTSWEFRKSDPRFRPEETLARGPSHPLSAKVKCLAGAGVDVVFAAGNAGSCAPSPSSPQGNIKPPNSESAVMTIAAVDAEKVRLGDSGQGGSTAPQKPDLSAFGSFRLQDQTYLRHTSMAAAFAAGLTASLRSLDGWSAAERTNRQVRKCFVEHADKTVQVPTQGGMPRITELTAHSNDFGHGVMRFESVHTWKDDCGGKP